MDTNVQRCCCSPLDMIFLILQPTRQQTCPLSAYFNGQRCAPCRSNCLCSTEFGCDQCLPGYTFSIYLTECLPCPAPANAPACTACCSQVAGTSYTCTQCDNSTGYTFLINGICVALPGCTNLSSYDYRCRSCASGFFLLDSTCTACHASCGSCFSQYQCIQCATTYFWNPQSNGALCSPCSAGCSICSVAACTTCLSDYYLAGSACLTCPATCSTCSAGGCLSCPPGRGLISGACPTCGTGCTACTGGSTLTCTQCGSGYFLQGAACQTCLSKFGAGVALCNSSAVIQCSGDSSPSLGSRYLLNSSCLRNSRLCKSADSAGQCLSCYFGDDGQSYYVLVGKACTLCPNILGCSSLVLQESACVCRSCASGYRLAAASYTCFACNIPRCSLCPESTSFCTRCREGFGLFAGGCSTCTPTNCLSCDNAPSVCQVCSPGYFLAGGQCQPCQTSCLSCSRGNLCLSCSPSSFNRDGLCQPLQWKCVAVDTDGDCLRCDYGYYLAAGLCQECSPAVWGMSFCQGTCAGIVLGAYLPQVALALLCLSL